MEKLTNDSPETRSLDVVAENIAQLKTLFPEATTEGRIDFEVLKQLLGEAVEAREERYGLNWHGKRKARLLALRPSTGTLRPCSEESVDWDSTRNLMIEGDNLEVLKLLQKSYSNQIKVIYIDPPYNTGHDFVYPDDFRDTIRNYLELTGQTEGGAKISSNSNASGRFHTDWLNMLLPRLMLARTLLRNDGVIFISIDDNEVHHLVQIMNEIFGEENFIANLVWEKKKKGAFLSGDSANIKEYVVVYSKSRESFGGLVGEIARDTETYPVIKTTNSRGRRTIRKGITSKFRQSNHQVPAGTRISSGNMEMILLSDLVIEDGRLVQDVEVESNWIYSQELLDKYAASKELYVTQDLYFRRIVNEPRTKMMKDILPMEGLQGATGASFRYSDNLFEDGWGTNEDGFDELHAIFGAQNVVNFPKPSKLISKLLLSVTRDDKDAFVMDFFAGSGTTAQSVWTLNAQDEGRRRVILVQIPEPLDSGNDSQAGAAAYCDQIGRPRNIAELTKERLRKVGVILAQSNPLFKGDWGFRVFKLDSSNIRPWEAEADDLPKTLMDAVEHIKEGRTEQDLLFELLLKLGLDLTVPMEQKTIVGKTIHSIGAGVLMVCLEEAIAKADYEALGNGIVAWHRDLAPTGETTLVFRDSAFADDVVKTNLTAILSQGGLHNVRSL